MLTIARDDSAVHGIALEPGVETVVEFARAPRTVELVVTTASDKPIFWTADDVTATVNGSATRLIPPGTIAVDEAEARPVPGGEWPRKVRVHVITEGSKCVISVQRGKFRTDRD